MKYLFVAAVFFAALLSGANVLVAQAATAEKILPSTISIDTANHTAVLPLYRGEFHGTPVWYILTDASDEGVARRFKVLYSPITANIGDAAIQRVSQKSGVPQFEGIPDFSKTRSYAASTGGFPPKSAQPGSVADANYSPFVRVEGVAGVLNAPIVAVGNDGFDVTTHKNTADRVIAVDTKAKTVTIVLARGFFNRKPILYLSTDASDPVAAAVERATYAPKLAKASNASQIPIGVVVNGPQTGSAPQGLAYLARRTPLDEDATLANAASLGSPFNVLATAPNADVYTPSGYSPLWSVSVVGAPQSKRLTTFAEIAPISKPAGFNVNCPIVAYGE